MTKDQLAPSHVLHLALIESLVSDGADTPAALLKTPTLVAKEMAEANVPLTCADAEAYLSEHRKNRPSDFFGDAAEAAKAKSEKAEPPQENNARPPLAPDLLERTTPEQRIEYQNTGRIPYVFALKPKKAATEGESISPIKAAELRKLKKLLPREKLEAANRRLHAEATAKKIA